ncbi:hypothetical protein EYF80_023159 [Liparis tanakae]|uniref:Uncharacterized protein n=1 Tax=Liparis tanakae TaxID=230148 RepID=A0A4Z2HMW1_9TELE|nr:hypothetical protein EYF80_023159 [Liparis tanakae]
MVLKGSDTNKRVHLIEELPAKSLRSSSESSIIQDPRNVNLRLGLKVHSQDVLVVADGVLAVFVLCADVPSEGLQDAGSQVILQGQTAPIIQHGLHPGESHRTHNDGHAPGWPTGRDLVASPLRQEQEAQANGSTQSSCSLMLQLL